jgi:hypothetical protein
MSTSATPAAAPQTTSDDEFGAGLFDQPVAKPAARHAPEPVRAPPPPAAPAAPAKPADEDDGFGAGLL